MSDAQDCKLITKALETWPEQLTAGTYDDHIGAYCAVGFIREANGRSAAVGLRGGSTEGDLSLDIKERIIEANDRGSSAYSRPDRRRARRMKAFCQDLLKEICR